MNDVVIGAIEGHKWSEIEQYAVSLYRSGFSGTKVMFVHKVPQETKVNLERFGFHLVEVTLPPQSIHYHMERFRLAADWLKDHAPHRFVIWMDVRDVIFQTNPSTWLEKNDTRPAVTSLRGPLFVGSEDILIKDEGSNSQWMLYGFGPVEYETIKNECVLNSGTIAGDAAEAQRLFAAIYEHCRNQVPHRPNGDHRFSGINDQAMLNMVARHVPFQEVVRIPKLADGLWAVCHATSRPQQFAGRLTDTPPVLRHGCLVNYNDAAFSIIHQYDRNPEWKAVLTEKYKARSGEAL